MNLNMLYKFVEQHEGKFPWTDGFSPEQRVAMSAFASWLDEQVAQQSVQADKCPACDGKGWFGAQFCEGEECPTCEGTGIRH